MFILTWRREHIQTFESQRSDLSVVISVIWYDPGHTTTLTSWLVDLPD